MNKQSHGKKPEKTVSIHVRNPSHLEAHQADFALPLEDLLAFAAEALTRRGPPRVFPVEEGFFVRCPRVTGRAGLARIWPWTRGDYWAPRTGRTIPSHLIAGKAKPTRELCVWGFWESEDSFILHTLYPGRPAPREIHDPGLKAGEMSRSIAFWKTHAIIVESE